MSRYQVIPGSKSAHCCFEFSVIDTKKDEAVCECFEEIDAHTICNALNGFSNPEDVFNVNLKVQHAAALHTWVSKCRSGQGPEGDPNHMKTPEYELVEHYTAIMKSRGLDLK